MSDVLVGHPPRFAEIGVEFGLIPAGVELSGACVVPAGVAWGEEVEQVSKVESKDFDRKVHRQKPNLCRLDCLCRPNKVRNLVKDVLACVFA
jgi:hypothetical protein